MKTIDEMIAVMQAAKEGKKIEVSDPADIWWDDCKPSWDWKHHDYRVKPVEPKRMFANIYPNGKVGFEFDCRMNGVTAEFIELTPEVKSKLGL